MKIRAFITHKKAELFSDCQDRFSISTDTKSVALADGMSQSYQQKIWANILVQQFTNHYDFVPNKEAIKELSTQWRAEVINFIGKLKTEKAPENLIYRNENSLAMHKSAGATFLGIRFNGQKWSGDVLGDSCLIEVEDYHIKRILTSQQGDQFDSYPDYFDSDALKDGKGTPLQIEGEINNKTSIILVSDPFSDFLSEKHKENDEEKYLKELFAVSSHDEYEELVARWRDNYGMHNDDSTLIIIENDDSVNFTCSHIDDIQILITEEIKQQSIAKQEQACENNNSAESQEDIQSKVHNTDPIEQGTAYISQEQFIQIFQKEFNKLLNTNTYRTLYNRLGSRYRGQITSILQKVATTIYNRLNNKEK